MSASRLSRLSAFAADEDDSADSLSDDDSFSKSSARGGRESRVHGQHDTHHGGRAHANKPPVQWVYGKPAHARLPQEVRLPEALQWRLHRMCARGSGEFQVRLLPAGASDDSAGELVDVSSERGGSGGEALTLSIGKASLHLRSGWNAPKRAQCEYAAGIGVSIEHWAKDIVGLHFPASARGLDAPPSSAIGVDGDATTSVSMRVEVLGGHEARDLLVLCLRYLVATAAAASAP